MGEIIFESVFAEEFRDLVDTKRALGFDYDSGELAFRRLDRFFIEEVPFGRSMLFTFATFPAPFSHV